MNKCINGCGRECKGLVCSIKCERELRLEIIKKINSEETERKEIGK